MIKWYKVGDCLCFTEASRLQRWYTRQSIKTKIRPIRHWQGFLGFLWQVWIDENDQ